MTSIPIPNRFEREGYVLTLPSSTALGVCGAIFMFSGFVLSRASLWQSTLILASLVCILLVLLFLNRPMIGILLLIPACIVVPLELGTGTNTTIHAGILLLLLLMGLWALNALAARRLPTIPRSGPILGLIALVIVATIAFASGQLSWFRTPGAPLRAQIGGLLVFVLSAGAFLIVAYRLHGLEPLKWMTWMYLGFGAYCIVGRLVPAVGQFTLRIVQRSAAESLFWTWLVALGAGQLLFNRHLTRTIRCFLACLIVGLFYVALSQGADWKSGWVPPAVALILLGLLRWPCLIPIAVFGAAFIAVDFLSAVIGSDAYSYSTRLEAWQVLGKMLYRNPVFGFGPANYYWYTPLYAIRGYYVSFSSHSQYVDLLLQTGIAGLSCFVWFVWGIGALGWRLRRQVPTGFACGYVYGALGGITGTLVAGALGDWVLPFVYNIGLKGMRTTIPAWLFLGGLIVLERMVKAEEDVVQVRASPG